MSCFFIFIHFFSKLFFCVYLINQLGKENNLLFLSISYLYYSQNTHFFLSLFHFILTSHLDTLKMDSNSNRCGQLKSNQLRKLINLKQYKSSLKKKFNLKAKLIYYIIINENKNHQLNSIYWVICYLCINSKNCLCYNIKQYALV